MDGRERCVDEVRKIFERKRRPTGERQSWRSSTAVEAHAVPIDAEFVRQLNLENAPTLETCSGEEPKQIAEEAKKVLATRNGSATRCRLFPESPCSASMVPTELGCYICAMKRLSERRDKP